MFIFISLSNSLQLNAFIGKCTFWQQLPFNASCKVVNNINTKSYDRNMNVATEMDKNVALYVRTYFLIFFEETNKTIYMISCLRSCYSLSVDISGQKCRLK